MIRFSYSYLILLLCFVFSSCQTDYANLATYSAANQLQAVIETPAGSSHKIRYNRTTKAFENETQGGKANVLNFLPYPGNYGFIPSTEVGANGRGISVLVLSEQAEAGTVLEIVPIATLMLEKYNGDLYPIIIAVPARPSEQTIKATNLATLSEQYPAVKSILQQWFVYHNHTASLKFIGWKDAQFAEKEIQRWMKL